MKRKYISTILISVQDQLDRIFDFTDENLWNKKDEIVKTHIEKMMEEIDSLLKENEK